MSAYPKECPNCHADLRGDRIPENLRKFYNKDDIHYYRAIGIVNRDMDRVTHWRCPDCGHEWERTYGKV